MAGVEPYKHKYFLYFCGLSAIRQTRKKTLIPTELIWNLIDMICQNHSLSQKLKCQTDKPGS